MGSRGTKELVGDQDAVVALSDERGIIPATEHSLTNDPVVRKRFRQIRYLKPSDREYADPLASVLRLPRSMVPACCSISVIKRSPRSAAN